MRSSGFCLDHDVILGRMFFVELVLDGLVSGLNLVEGILEGVKQRLILLEFISNVRADMLSKTGYPIKIWMLISYLVQLLLLSALRTVVNLIEDLITLLVELLLDELLEGSPLICLSYLFHFLGLWFSCLAIGQESFSMFLWHEDGEIKRFILLTCSFIIVYGLDEEVDMPFHGILGKLISILEVLVVRHVDELPVLIFIRDLHQIFIK